MDYDELDDDRDWTQYRREGPAVSTQRPGRIDPKETPPGPRASAQHTSSAPAYSSSSSRQRDNQQDGSRSTGRGQGGKGQTRRPQPRERDDLGDADTFSSLRQVVQNSQRLLLAVAATQRQQLRMVQYVVLFLPEADDLKQLLFQARPRYHDEKPDSGPHPQGSIHDLMWSLFSHYCSENPQIFAPGVYDRAIELFQGLAERRMVHVFSPKGKIRGGPTEVWPWKFQIDSSTTMGLACQTTLSDLVSRSELETSIFLLRRDNGKPGALERTLIESSIRD
jgi:hypothetical protein